MSGDTNDGVCFGDVIIVDLYEGDVICRWYRLRSTITDTFASPANIVSIVVMMAIFSNIFCCCCCCSKNRNGKKGGEKNQCRKLTSRYFLCLCLISYNIILMHFRGISVCCCWGFLLLLLLFCFDVVDGLPVYPEDKAVNPESILIRRERRNCVKII